MNNRFGNPVDGELSFRKVSNGLASGGSCLANSRNGPAVVRPSDVIAGWREALEMMPAGSQWRLFIPPQLAYGTTPPPSIPPDSLLIFDVEVLGVEPAVAATHPTPAKAASR